MTNASRLLVSAALLWSGVAACEPLEKNLAGASRPSLPIDVQSCTTSANPLVHEDLPISSIASSIEFSSAVEPGDLEIVNAFSLNGPCAPFVVNFKVSNALLEDGTILEYVNDDYSIKTDFLYVFDPPKIDESQVPAPESAEILDVDRYVSVRRSGGMKRGYITLWKDEEWSVAAFTLSANGIATEPAPLFTSALPLRSASFFTSPDEPSGNIFLVQEGPGGQKRVIVLFWKYGG